MKESEAIEKLKNMRLFMQIEDKNNDCKFTEDDYKANEMAIQALEKQIPKKPIEKEMPYSEDVGFNSEWHCPCCNSYIGYFTEGMSETEQMEYCNNCGQHIAKDWSDEE